MSEKYFLELDPRVDKVQSHDWAADTTVEKTIDNAWLSDVRDLISQIEQSRVGKILLEEIGSHKKWIRIMYYEKGSVTSRQNFCEADKDGTIGPGTSLSGERRFYSALVRVTPKNLGAGSSCAKWVKESGGAVGEPHEILFHELVHALHQVSGTKNNRRLHGGLWRYNNTEEFDAITVTNIYASANGKGKRVLLRSSHTGFRAMEDELDDSFNFFKSGFMVFRLIHEYNSANEAFCRKLEGVQCEFNPIRAYRRNANKARKLSDQAFGRDLEGRLVPWGPIPFPMLIEPLQE